MNARPSVIRPRWYTHTAKTISSAMRPRNQYIQPVQSAGSSTGIGVPSASVRKELNCCQINQPANTARKTRLTISSVSDCRLAAGAGSCGRLSGAHSSSGPSPSVVLRWELRSTSANTSVTQKHRCTATPMAVVNSAPATSPTSPPLSTRASAAPSAAIGTTMASSSLSSRNQSR